MVLIVKGGMSVFVDANFFTYADIVKKAVPFVVN